MRRVLLLVAVAAVMAAMMLVSALPAFAHPVGNHRHFLATPEESKVGEVEVGPRVCDVGETTKGFHQFHHNVHVSDNPTTVSGKPC